jgi:uncharacterized protein (DUF697 family)
VIATIEELEQVRRNCRALVRRRARAAGAAAAIPVPGLDLAADVALLLQVIPAINRRFGLTPEQIESLDAPLKIVTYRVLRKFGVRFAGRAITAELIISAMASFGASLAVDAVTKFVPVVGTIASAVIGYEVFKRIAYSHIEECSRVVRDLIAAE